MFSTAYWMPHSSETGCSWVWTDISKEIGNSREDGDIFITIKAEIWNDPYMLFCKIWHYVADPVSLCELLEGPLMLGSWLELMCCYQQKLLLHDQAIIKQYKKQKSSGPLWFLVLCAVLMNTSHTEDYIAVCLRKFKPQINYSWVLSLLSFFLTLIYDKKSQTTYFKHLRSIQMSLYNENMKYSPVLRVKFC